MPHSPAYRDAEAPIAARVDDLLARMSLAEKAGVMFQPMIAASADGTLGRGNPTWGQPSTDELLGARHITHLTVLGTAVDARAFAEWHNLVQERAQQTRLGIPVTLSTDPRHHFTDNVGAASLAGALSQWPEPIGLAALRSPELVREFADIARQEYLAIGLRLAIHPQIDLATEPRWSRIAATFGEQAELASELTTAYVQGLQGVELGPQSVAAMAKHFPGGGPQKDGEDPHFTYGKEQVYPGGMRELHLEPFRAAIAAGVSQIMPYYGMPVGTDWDEVGFAFSRGIVTELLREQLGFEGIVCTDYGLVHDGSILGQPMPARAWGLEDADELTRLERLIDAGCDTIGGESTPELLIALVEQGRVSEARIDQSVRRLLRDKFRLGLFDAPFVDVDVAAEIVGRSDFVAAGALAQRRSYTLLANDASVLPLAAGRRLFVRGVDPSVAERVGTLVDDPHDAEFALVRIAAPHEPRPGAFESRFHSGSLEFPAETVAELLELCATVPTVIDVTLERPAVLTPLVDAAAALLGSYGSSDEAFLDVVTGRVAPEGRLPFDLPRSMDAVIASRPDVPFDTEHPLFRFGHGLGYS